MKSALTGPTFRLTAVEGTAVHALNGDRLRSIDELFVDKASGQIRYAALEFAGFLGIGADLYPVPWCLLRYDANKDGYCVDIHREQLDQAPKYREHGDVFHRR